MPTMKLYINVNFFDTVVVSCDILLNFSDSLSSRPKPDTTLMACRVSSAIPPSYLLTSTFSMVNFLTMLPKTPMIAKRRGR